VCSPSDYTIERAKQKAEEDAKIAAAESKKMGERPRHQRHLILAPVHSMCFLL